MQETIEDWTTEDLLTRRNEFTYPFSCEEVLSELTARLITDENSANRGGIRPTRPL